MWMEESVKMTAKFLSRVQWVIGMAKGSGCRFFKGYDGLSGCTLDLELG